MKPTSIILLCVATAALLWAGSDAGPADQDRMKAAMVAACTGDHPKLLRLVRGGRVDPNVQVFGLTLLAHAASCGHAEAVELLLRHGASPDLPSADDRTPLMLAAATPLSTGALHVLLEAGADASAVDPAGVSVLMYAVASHEPEHVRLVLEAGADAEHRSPTGSSALDWAIGYGDPVIIELVERERQGLAAGERRPR